MRQKVAHAHGGSFSEPMQGSFIKQVFRELKGSTRDIVQHGLFTPPPSLPAEIIDVPGEVLRTFKDSGHSFKDSGHSFKDYGHSFKDSGHSFKDSGYSSRRSTPACSPGRPTYIARSKESVVTSSTSSEESVVTSSASSVVGVERVRGSPTEIRSQKAALQHSESQNDVSLPGPSVPTGTELGSLSIAPENPDDEATRSENSFPQTVKTSHRGDSGSKVVQVDWPQLLGKPRPVERKRKERIRRCLYRCRFWRRSADSNRSPRKDSDDRKPVEDEIKTTSNAREMTANIANQSPGQIPFQKPFPNIAKLPDPVLFQASIQELGTSSPTLPPDLPSAIANPEIEHTESQPTSFLGRTPNSSRTLDSLSAGEMSFMGIENTGEGHLGPHESVNKEMAEYLGELAGKIVRRCIRESTRSGFREHGGHQNGPSSSSSSSSSAQSSPNVTPVSSVTNTPVHSRFPPKAQDDPGDEDGMKRQRTPKRKHSNGDLAVKLFACPYTKFDPSRYSRENLSEPNYWNCGSCCLRDISRLKQHLYRVHSKPSYYCGSCFQSFKSREDLDQHARQRPPCEISDARFADRMTDSQFQAIKRRVLRGDPPELWFNIYSILFPGVPKPPSPYVSSADAATVNHFVALFRWFGPDEMMSAFSNRYVQPGLPPLDLSTQTVVDEAFEIALPDYLRQRSSSQLSADPIAIQVERTSQVLEEDVLTMAPFTGGQSHRHALFEVRTAPSDHFRQGVEAEMEDSTPRAHVNPSETSIEDPFRQEFEGVTFQGWPGMQSEIQAAFNNYMPFSDPTLQPAAWAMPMPEVATFQTVDSRAPSGPSNGWTQNSVN